MFNVVQWYSMMFNDVQWCTMMSNDVLWCLMMSNDVQWCLMMSNDVQNASKTYVGDFILIFFWFSFGFFCLDFPLSMQVIFGFSALIAFYYVGDFFWFSFGFIFGLSALIALLYVGDFILIFLSNSVSISVSVCPKV